MRACWEAAAPLPDAVPGGTSGAGALAQDRTHVRRIEFVEVRSTATTVVKTRRRGNGATGDMAGEGLDQGAAGAVVATTRAEVPVGAGPGEPRWSLWGEGER